MTMNILGIVVCFLCVNFLMASETYKAGVVLRQNKEINAYTPFIYEAGNTGVDILVLPALESSASADNYDEAVKVISKAAKQAGLYVVTHLYEKTRCQLGYETIRSNLVFDRQGSIVAVYRKPLNGVANCTTSPSDLVTFTTDFGVTFGVLMEEDTVLHDVEHMRGLKNFVMTGVWHSEVPFLNAAQFSPSWSYVTNANLVSTTGIYSGQAGLKRASEELAVADLYKNGGNDHPAVPSVNPLTVNLQSEDLSQYVLKSLDFEASSKGYTETVCHRSFCCEFYVKTGVTGTKPEVSYRLGAFDGIRNLGHNHISAQVCALMTCTGNQRSGSGSENSITNISFERISIAANFTKQNAQYPIVQSFAEVPTENFKFETKSDGMSKQVTLQIVDSQDVINFGIFGKEFETNFGFGERNNTEATNEIYDFIFNEDVLEFFDYVWIRLRILIVVVSIYILEML